MELGFVEFGSGKGKNKAWLVASTWMPLAGASEGMIIVVEGVREVRKSGRTAEKEAGGTRGVGGSSEDFPKIPSLGWIAGGMRRGLGRGEPELLEITECPGERQVEQGRFSKVVERRTSDSPSKTTLISEG